MALPAGQKNDALFHVLFRRVLVLSFLATVVAKDEEKKIDGPVIGIDLGSTKTALGVWRGRSCEA